MHQGSSDIAVFIPSFGDGGVERMLVNLSSGFVGRGLKVDFLVKDRSGPYIPLLDEGVRIIETGTTESKAVEAFLCDYLRKTPPRVLMSAKKCDREAIRARNRTGAPTRVFLRVGTTVSRRDQKRPIKRFFAFRRMRTLYPQADGMIAVSQGVADDVVKIVGLPQDQIRVIRNPVVTPQMLSMAQEPCPHPWFGDGGSPVILGAGGLRRQKEFHVLIDAFAALRKSQEARLVILGKGRLEAQLKQQADDLGVAEAIDMPGFATNPYPYMREADLFVLSSAWEGSPNVLAESLALGTPAVSTDCPSGPREILQGGEFGPLVEVGDADGLTAAMLQTLQSPPQADFLRQAVAEYQLDKSVGRYLEVFGLL